MRAIRTRPISNLSETLVASNAAMGLYGNNRAGKFLRDARVGADSVDIITIGDSNAGIGAYGYTRGIHRVMSYQYGVDVYACSLMSGGSYLNSFTFSGISDGMVMTGHLCDTSLDGTAGGTASTGVCRQMTRYTSDSEINALVSYLNFNSTNWTNDATTMLPKVNAWQWMPVVIPTGILWSSPSGSTNSATIGPGAALASASPLSYGAAGTGGNLCQYRLVYGTFNASGGQFKLSVFNQTSFGLNARSANFISTMTSGGGYGYKTATLDFTTQTSANPGVYCSWDGANQGVFHLCTGPFAALWMSVIIKNKKGYSVSNLVNNGGLNGTQIADRVEGMDKVLDSYLKEIRERQQAAGGSGRVVVWVNYGINTDTSPSVGAAWTNASDRIKARIQQRWASTQGDPANLAFVFTVSHPVPSGTVSPWDTNRPAVAAAANTWASQNANDNSGTSVVDIGNFFTDVDLTKGVAPSGTMYDSGGQAHLNSTLTSGSNGYDAVTGAVFSSLMNGA